MVRNPKRSGNYPTHENPPTRIAMIAESCLNFLSRLGFYPHGNHIHVDARGAIATGLICRGAAVELAEAKLS